VAVKNKKTKTLATRMKLGLGGELSNEYCVWKLDGQRGERRLRKIL